MSPGIDDQARNTGALPKSNRRSDRNRERDQSFNNNYGQPYRDSAQHSNNLIDWQTVNKRQPKSTTPRTTKNSNTRSTPTARAYDLDDIGSYNSQDRLYPNIYTRDDLSPWLKMTPPVDSRIQSPPNHPAKPTNTDKMPERSHLEGRLNQIREYIKVTSNMMDLLSVSGDPRAQAQREKLSKMVEDLYDSEQKLSKLMEDCEKYWKPNENGEVEGGEKSREQELQKKVEESQRKLAQLQEHQSHLVGMQLEVRERLNEARQAQRALLAEDDEEEEEKEPPEQRHLLPTTGNVEQLERETVALRNKLQQLENKKLHMDHLVQELQAVELIERGSCSSGGSRPMSHRDKVAELEAMKAQLSYLKALMNEATRCRENDGTRSDSEHEEDVPNNDTGLDIYQVDENAESTYSNSFNDAEDVVRSKRTADPPTVDQIQAITRELKEQQQVLQSARAEIQRLKQTSTSKSQSAASVTSSTPPPSVFIEEKPSNNLINNDTRVAQNKRRQIEDYMRKDQSQSLSINQNGSVDWSARRGSNSQHSHSSIPGNLWPPPANLVIAGSQDHNIDGLSTAENLLEIGSQAPIENGFGGNYWGMPNALVNHPPQGAIVGSEEYYKQLFLGSQAQQLQLMSTTIQQCCQLLWAQQREMQSMKSAIAQLQTQLRHTRMGNVTELHEEQHSNLLRAGPHFGSLEATLPPSSSLPNLVSLPVSSPAPAPPPPPPPVNCPQQQLNNQVPPGNRANNYWDNFRSYSRQNLLSGSTKTVTDCAVGAAVHPVSTTNANGVITSHMNNKCNRQQCQENIPMVGCPESHYLLNLQISPNSRQQEPINATRNAGLLVQQPLQEIDDTVENRTSTRSVSNRRMGSRSSKKLSQREAAMHILKYGLEFLESQSQNESNSSDSSDDESEAGVRESSSIQNAGNLNVSSQMPTTDYAEPETISNVCDTNSSQYILEEPEFSDSFLSEKAIIPSSSVSRTESSNENLTESDKQPKEISNSNNNNNNKINENGIEDVTANGTSMYLEDFFDL